MERAAIVAEVAAVVEVAAEVAAVVGVTRLLRLQPPAKVAVCPQSQRPSKTTK